MIPQNEFIKVNVKNLNLFYGVLNCQGQLKSCNKNYLHKLYEELKNDSIKHLSYLIMISISFCC